ncbi:DUF3703 domain-containing protein [Paraglaciecola aestuariivivens]
MKSRFYQTIKPYVEHELALASLAANKHQYAEQFSHLETAHVLAQGSTRLHTKIHWLMLQWALNQGDVKEALGQITRIIGAATKTPFGLVPKGNTGGSNVSPFKVMPIKPELETILNQARQKESSH